MFYRFKVLFFSYLIAMNNQAFNYLKGAWSFFVLVFLVISIHLNIKSNNEKIKETAKSFFNEILITRAWSSMHGGVYVFADDNTLPNPYLTVPNQNIYTTDSLLLTLINHSEMTRQISELATELNNIHYHITSLMPLRDLNFADEWETNALMTFEEGETYSFERNNYNGEDHYRYMEPLMVEENCLKCHADQGYKLGDIRGGISVNINPEPYVKELNILIASISIIHLVFLIIGLFGITYAQRIVQKQFKLTRLKSQQLALHKNRLTQSNQMLEELNKQKEKFLSIIAHDLRSPVGAIMELSKILMEEIETSDIEDSKIMLENLHSSAVNTFALMENLLTWSRSKQGKMEINPTKLSLKEEVHKAIDFTNKSIDTKGILISSELGDCESAELIADKDMLNVILRNLLTNSVKFTNKNGSIKVLAAKQNKDKIEITVQDTGVGIPKEKVKDLFKINKSVSTPGTRNEKGTGLGLILVKEFIELNKGTIKVESEVNVGTSFTFTLPIIV